MFTRFSGGSAKAESPGQTSLLKLLAGEFAPRVAALWPDPHSPFLTAPAVRRATSKYTAGTAVEKAIPTTVATLTPSAAAISL